MIQKFVQYSALESLKANMNTRNYQQQLPTNLAKINKLPTSKVWASSYRARGQPTRGFISMREQNTFGGKRRISRLVLLLLYGRLIE